MQKLTHSTTKVLAKARFLTVLAALALFTVACGGSVQTPPPIDPPKTVSYVEREVLVYDANWSPVFKVIGERVYTADVSALKFRVRDGVIFNPNWQTQGFIRDDVIYDTGWQVTHFIKGDAVYDKNWVLVFHIKH